MGRDDLLERMRRNPAAGWRISDVLTLCNSYGVACEPMRGGGSHYKVKHPTQRTKPSVPFARPIKAVYIRQLVAFIDAVRSST